MRFFITPGCPSGQRGSYSSGNKEGKSLEQRETGAKTKGRKGDKMEGNHILAQGYPQKYNAATEVILNFLVAT